MTALRGTGNISTLPTIIALPMICQALRRSAKNSAAGAMVVGGAQRR